MTSLLEKLLIFTSAVAVVSALDCISCDWNAQNDTVDDHCLGAPFKTEFITCPKSDSPGKRYMCQTHAEFEYKSGSQNLKLVERTCGLKHSKCNNACADDVTDCWLCCDDYSNCNGFPTRSNIVVSTSTGSSLPHFINFQAYIILATVWPISLCIS